MIMKREQKASRIVEPQAASSDLGSFETTLRPQKLSEYIGQSKIKRSGFLARNNLLAQ